MRLLRFHFTGLTTLLWKVLGQKLKRKSFQQKNWWQRNKHCKFLSLFLLFFELSKIEIYWLFTFSRDQYVLFRNHSWKKTFLKSSTGKVRSSYKRSVDLFISDPPSNLFGENSQVQFQTLFSCFLWLVKKTNFSFIFLSFLGWPVRVGQPELGRPEKRRNGVILLLLGTLSHVPKDWAREFPESGASSHCGA